MDFAICLWDLDIEPAMQEQIFEGVSAVEPGAPVLSDTDRDLLQAQAEMLRGRNIEIYSAHAPFGPEHDLSSSDSEKRDGAVQSTLLALRNAALIGAQCVVLHPGPPVPTEQRSARWDNLRESIEHLLPKAEELEVALALENLLPGYLGDQTISLRKFVDRFDSSLLGFCFDTGHAHLNDEGVMQAFEVLREDIINFHIQDNDGWMDRHIQPPYGTIDWDALAPELRSLDFEHPFALETLPWGRAGSTQMLREIRTLFKYGALRIDTEHGPVRPVCHECGHYRFGTAESWFCACREGGTHGNSS